MHTRDRRSGTNLYTKEQVSRVIAGAGITVESKMGSEYIIFCPFHGNSRTPAGEVNEESGLFFCFSCQKVADLIELVMHMTQRSYFEAVRFITSKSTDRNIEDDVNQQLIKQPDFVEFDKLVVQRLHDQAMASDQAINYYAGRKITKESVQKFMLGYSVNQNMVTIPVHAPDGMLLGFVGRSIEGKEFKNTPGLPKSKLLFNLHRVKTNRTVYVVESSFDAIRLDQCGLPAVATLGATVSNPQIELLQKYFNDVIIIPDNDEAGEGMVERLRKALGSNLTRLQLNKQYKDIGDMTDDEIKNLETKFDNIISSMLN